MFKNNLPLPYPDAMSNRPRRPKSCQDPTPTQAQSIRRALGKALTAYERHLLYAIETLAAWSDCHPGTRLNYISAIASLDGSWRQGYDELRPMIKSLADRCPRAERHLRLALYHLRTAAHALKVLNAD
jgi:hypothetical protein